MSISYDDLKLEVREKTTVPLSACPDTVEYAVLVKNLQDNTYLPPTSYTIKSVTTDPSIQYTVSQTSSDWRITFIIPDRNETISIKITVTVKVSDTNAEYSYSHDWTMQISGCEKYILVGEVKTDRLYYDYGSTEPVKITVAIKDGLGKPLSGLTVTDNWNNTYTDEGDGTYKAKFDISKLPPGQYSIYIKTSSTEHYRDIHTDQYIKDLFVYTPVVYPNQDFKLTYPLVESLYVTINGKETTNYSTSLNQFGELILHIDDNLIEGDVIEVKYLAHTISTTFYVGNTKPITCTLVDSASIVKYGRTPIMTITVPFLQSQEEACEIAELYLKYYAYPTKVISTNNKW